MLLLEPLAIASDVRKFVISNFLFGEAGSLNDQTLLMEGGIIDSTGILELVTYLEATYEIRVETEDLLPENLDAIERITAFVCRKKAVAFSV